MKSRTVPKVGTIDSGLAIIEWFAEPGKQWTTRVQMIPVLKSQMPSTSGANSAPSVCYILALDALDEMESNDIVQPKGQSVSFGTSADTDPETHSTEHMTPTKSATILRPSRTVIMKLAFMSG